MWCPGNILKEGNGKPILHGCQGNYMDVFMQWLETKLNSRKYFLLLTYIYLSTKFQNALRNSVAWTYTKYVLRDYDTLLGKKNPDLILLLIILCSLSEQLKG